MVKRISFNKIINRLILFISIGVLGHILFLLFTTDKEIIYEINKIKFRYLLIIGLLVLMPWIGHATRLVIWSTFLKCKLTFKEALKVAVTTDLGAALTPTLIGGGPVKLGMLLNYRVPAAKAGILIGMNGFEDLIFYLSGIILATIFAREAISQILYSIQDTICSNAAIFLILLSIILLYIFLRRRGIIKYKLDILYLFRPKTKRLLLKIFIGIRNSYKEMKNTLLLIWKEGKLQFLISFTILIIQWAAKFTILNVLLFALGIEVPYVSIYLKQWLVWLTMIFIPTPGATGGAEASFYLLFGSSIPEEILSLIVSTWRFFTYYFIMLSSVLIYQFISFISYLKNKN